MASQDSSVASPAPLTDMETSPAPPFLDPPGTHAHCVIEVAVKSKTTFNLDYDGDHDVTDPLYAEVLFSEWLFRAPWYSVIHKDDDTKLSYVACLQTVIRRFVLRPRLKPSCPELVGIISTPPTATTPMSSYVVWHTNMHNFGLQFLKTGPLLSAKQRRRFVGDRDWRNLLSAPIRQWWWEFGLFMSRSIDGGWPAVLDEEAEASGKVPSSSGPPDPLEEDWEAKMNLSKRRKVETEDPDAGDEDKTVSYDPPSPDMEDLPPPVPSTLVLVPEDAEDEEEELTDIDELLGDTTDEDLDPRDHEHFDQEFDPLDYVETIMEDEE